MTDNIKGFFQVKEDPHNILFFIELLGNLVSELKHAVDSGFSFLESILVLIEEAVSFEVVH